MVEAVEGDSVILTLEDEIDISRGDMIVRCHNIPRIDNEIEATLAWMDDRNSLSTSPLRNDWLTGACGCDSELVDQCWGWSDKYDFPVDDVFISPNFGEFRAVSARPFQ